MPDLNHPLVLLVLAQVALVAVVIFGSGALWFFARRLRPGPLRTFLRFVPACFTTMRRLKGQSVATRAKVALVMAVVWLISPVDAIPDVLPIIGMLDDIFIAVTALRYAARQLDRDILLNAWPEGVKVLQRLLGFDSSVVEHRKDHTTDW